MVEKHLSLLERLIPAWFSLENDEHSANSRSEYINFKLKVGLADIKPLIVEYVAVAESERKEKAAIEKHRIEELGKLNA